jgi:hypothetical protein
VPGATVVVIPNKRFDGSPEDALRSALIGHRVQSLHRL